MLKVKKGVRVMQITYQKVGEYQIPDLALEKKNRKVNLGKFAIMRLNFLKESKKALYQSLLMKDQLTEHLLKIDSQATTRLEQIMKDLIQKQNITEEMKAQDQMNHGDRSL